MEGIGLAICSEQKLKENALSLYFRDIEAESREHQYLKLQARIPAKFDTYTSPYFPKAHPTVDGRVGKERQPGGGKMDIVITKLTSRSAGPLRPRSPTTKRSSLLMRRLISTSKITFIREDEIANAKLD
ncbi:hypothetical protein C0Q70_00856 [Pomacea canaliculata]|uniref:Uncharacterized protein n=1 Tax=Pomacea canaliculata TaxID=400727 RepID=A0A2T7PXU0_POMCA|nr:hypothetical protein C0Q70_00856 [Pomacea canaliculata]